jgi:hypothetical protein
MNHGVIAARKFIFGWQGIALVLIAISFYWYMITLEIPEVRRLLSLAPMVRIGGAVVLVPPILLLFVILSIMLVLRAVPAYEGVSAFLGRVVNIMVLWIMIPLFFFVLLIARPLQQHYMPKLGYSQCSLLSGNRALYFTDWVKNPAWCVKGKDREWVFEQAKLAEGVSANPASVSVPADKK